MGKLCKTIALVLLGAGIFWAGSHVAHSQHFHHRHRPHGPHGQGFGRGGDDVDFRAPEHEGPPMDFHRRWNGCHKERIEPIQAVDHFPGDTTSEQPSQDDTFITMTARPLPTEVDPGFSFEEYPHERSEPRVISDPPELFEGRPAERPDQEEPYDYEDEESGHDDRGRHRFHDRHRHVHGHHGVAMGVGVFVAGAAVGALGMKFVQKRRERREREREAPNAPAAGEGSSQQLEALFAEHDPGDEPLISRLKTVMEKLHLTPENVTAHTGVTSIVLALWMQQKYNGDNRKVRQKIWEWLLRLEAQIQSQYNLSGLSDQLKSEDGSSEIGGIDLSKLSGVKRSSSYEVSAEANNTNDDRTDSKKLRRGSLDNSKPSVFDFRVMGGEALIPISINERHGNHVYEDLILWNINESTVTAEMFLKSISRDRKLPNAMQVKILASFKKQISAWVNRIDIPNEILDRDKERGFLILELDIYWKGFRLKDKIIWDPYNSFSNPETFATTFCEDIGLHSEWSLVVAHQVRQHVLRHFRALAQTGTSPVKRYSPPTCSSEGDSIFQAYQDIKQSQFLQKL